MPPARLPARPLSCLSIAAACTPPTHFDAVQEEVEQHLRGRQALEQKLAAQQRRLELAEQQQQQQQGGSGMPA